MDILTNTVPAWVSISFLLTFPISFFMIAHVAKQGAIHANLGNQKATRLFGIVLIFYTIYSVYVSTVSISGFFMENSLPPKILLYTAFPLLAFYLLVISNLEIYKVILEKVTLQALVGIHLFRFIGIFFIITNAYGAIPAKFAYIGGLGDIATAIFAIFVIKALDSKKSYAKKLVIIWNIFGLCDIFSVLTTAIITTRISIETGSQNIVEIANFPFALIPAFAPATIIFLHITTFRKLRLH
jgi:hypothetical protein